MRLLQSSALLLALFFSPFSLFSAEAQTNTWVGVLLGMFSRAHTQPDGAVYLPLT